MATASCHHDSTVRIPQPAFHSQDTVVSPQPEVHGDDSTVRSLQPGVYSQESTAKILIFTDELLAGASQN